MKTRVFLVLLFLALICNVATALTVGNPVYSAQTKPGETQTFTFYVSSDSGASITSDEWIAVSPQTVPAGNSVPVEATVTIPQGITTSGELKGYITINGGSQEAGTFNVVEQYRLPVKMQVNGSATPTPVPVQSPEPIQTVNATWHVYQTYGQMEMGIIIGVFAFIALCIVIMLILFRED